MRWCAALGVDMAVPACLWGASAPRGAAVAAGLSRRRVSGAVGTPPLASVRGAHAGGAHVVASGGAAFVAPHGAASLSRRGARPAGRALAPRRPPRSQAGSPGLGSGEMLMGDHGVLSYRVRDIPIKKLLVANRGGDRGSDLPCRGRARGPNGGGIQRRGPCSGIQVQSGRKLPNERRDARGGLPQH